MATLFLNLDLPTPSVTLGPEWASEINTAFEVIDEHDHSSGKGKQVPTSGLNINADLDFQTFRATSLGSTKFENLSATLTGAPYAGSVYVASGDLYYTNTSGIAVQITAGGSLPTTPGAVQSLERFDVSGDVTISPSDTFVYLSVDTTIDREITLPLAASVSDGRIFIIKDISGQSNSNPITLVAAGSDTVDGDASVILESDYGSWWVVGDSVSRWSIS